MTQKVLVTQRFFDDEAIAFLHAHGCEPVIAELPDGEADGNVPHETLVQWLQGASGWIVGHARVTRQLLADLPGLRVISRRGVGYDRVDTAAVKDLGRVACIAAGSNDPTVADLAVGLMLALGRRFPEGMDNVVSLDTNDFVKRSIEEGINTLLEAVVLVELVVNLFLHSFRTTIICKVAIMVSQIATIAAMTLLLAAAGVYSLISFTLSSRTREIGIRTALGASPLRIVRGILSPAFMKVALGIVMGSIPGTALVHATLAWGISSRMTVFATASVALFIIAVAAISCIWPVRRALKIQPTDALRTT